MTTPHQLQAKSLNAPDETRPFTDKGKVDIVTLGAVTVGRGVVEPGWRWSEHARPIAGTDFCQAAHTGYVLAGRMHVRVDDGT